MSSEDVKQIVNGVQTKMLWSGAIFLVTVGVTWGTLSTQLSAAKDDVSTLKKTDASQQESIVQMKTDIRYIREDVMEQKQLIKQVLDEVRQRS